MGKVICRQVHCQMCGAELEHVRTGRPRRFCSIRCRVAHYRAAKAHGRACVEAAQAGQPEPAKDYGQPVEFRHYEVDDAGEVARLPGPGKEIPTGHRFCQVQGRSAVFEPAQ